MMTISIAIDPAELKPFKQNFSVAFAKRRSALYIVTALALNRSAHRRLGRR
jgi:hypothetical protein